MMESKSMQRTNSLSLLTRKPSLKSQRFSKAKLEPEEQKAVEEKITFGGHPAAAFLRGSNPGFPEFKKFATVIYKGLFYSINNLKGPSEEFINKKKVKLPEPAESKKKFLMLDLDETLIHSVFTAEKTDVKFLHKGDEFKFNVRPYCMEFLDAMSNYYNLYVFTAGTQDYAEPIVAYLNQKKKTILGVMHRKNCMETQNGFFIKDLRIIQNRPLEQIVIVDNLVHSFGLQINNGVPILEFTNSKTDREFIGLEKLLIEISGAVDVREIIKEKISLTKCLEISETQFLTVEQPSKV